MGPLESYRVIEIAGIGPGPYCGMLLADMGAEVVRVCRPDPGMYQSAAEPARDLLNRSRRSICVDLKRPEGVETLLRMVDSADALFEGFRPGVMERLGLGPDVCLELNPSLVYGRMTGFGQDGPMAQGAGHDINYIALAGVLAHIGRAEGPPVPPLNLVGDFGGGGLMLAFGMVCALLERVRSGKGQVVDAAMVDGAASLMTVLHASAYDGWGPRGQNIVDGGAPFYETYETADGKYVSIGSIEPQFFAKLMELTGQDDFEVSRQMDESQWPALRERLTKAFRAKTRDEWCALMEGGDVCFAPVLSMQEAHVHPHNVARGTFVEVDGVIQPRPAPRLSRSDPEIRHGAVANGANTDEVLLEWGLEEAEIARLREAQAIR